MVLEQRRMLSPTEGRAFAVSEEEKRLLKLLGMGFSQKDISAEIGESARKEAVKNLHVIFAVSNDIGLVIVGIEQNIIDPEEIIKELELDVSWLNTLTKKQADYMRELRLTKNPNQALTNLGIRVTRRAAVSYSDSIVSSLKVASINQAAVVFMAAERSQSLQSSKK